MEKVELVVLRAESHAWSHDWVLALDIKNFFDEFDWAS
jgi:hypothetical protein